MNVKGLTRVSQGQFFYYRTTEPVPRVWVKKRLTGRYGHMYHVFRWPMTLGPPKKNKKPSNQDQVRWLVQMSVQKTVPTLPFPRQWDYYKLCPNLPFPSLNQFQCSQEQQLYDYWHGFYFKITTKTMKNDIGGKTEILFADKVLEYICLHIGEIVKIIHNFLFLTE